jgi:hypothetical protein
MEDGANRVSHLNVDTSTLGTPPDPEDLRNL